MSTRQTWNAFEVLEGAPGKPCSVPVLRPGVIRYITNKPKINVDGGLACPPVTARPRAGDPNSDLTAVLNLPLIADTLAVRGVIYNDRRGGYINKRAGHFHSQGEAILASATLSIRRAAGPTPHPLPGPA